MTVGELGNKFLDWLDEAFINVLLFFVDMYGKISNGDILELTLWQGGFILFIIWVFWLGFKE